MLDKKGFDLWAKEYDDDVTKSYINKQYPFDGYYDVLNQILDIIQPDSKVLDLGFGTGVLTKKIYDLNATIYGVDFSGEMVKIAKEKMPNGKFFVGDFNNGLPEEIINQKYDYIVSTYAIHHLTNNKKVELLIMLKNLLNENGKIIIGDTSFLTNEDLKQCKEKYGNRWDDDEIYIIADELIPMLNTNGIVAEYKKISSCAGIMICN